MKTGAGTMWRLVWLSMGVLACSSTPAPAPAVAPPPPSVAAAAAEVAPDLSPVGLPAHSLATLRVGPLRALSANVGQHLGLGEVLSEALVEALPSMTGDDEAVARAIDLDAPVDALVTLPRRRAYVTMAFGTGLYGRTRAALSDGHHLEAFGGPSFAAQRIARTVASIDRSPMVLAAAPQPAGGARLVVHERPIDDVEAFQPTVGYLTRTLAMQPFSAQGGDIQAELHLEHFRAAYLNDLTQFRDNAVREAGAVTDPNNPAFTESWQGWIRDFTSTLPAILTELTRVNGAVRLPEARVQLEANATLHAPTAPLVRQFLEASQGQAVPTELLERLPAGGYLYGASALSLAPFRALLNLGPALVSRALVTRTRLSADDSTALRTSLTALFAQERVATAVTLGADEQGRPWSVSLFQITTPPAQFVANVRAVIAAMRRPGVVRAARAEQQFDPMTWQVAPGAGLPPGALLVRVPTNQNLFSLERWLETATQNTPNRPTASQPAPGTTPRTTPGTTPGTTPRAPAQGAAGGRNAATVEVMLVPDGQRLWWVMGADARARYRLASAAHPAPVTLGAPGDAVRGVVAVMPAAVAEFNRSNGRMFRLLNDAVTRAGEGGRAPSILRLAIAENGEDREFRWSFDVPSQAIAVFAQSFQQR